MESYAPVEPEAVVLVMATPHLFNIFTFVAFYALAGFVVLGIASALYYISELAEEYSAVARRAIKTAIPTIGAMFFLMMVVDGLSWWRCLLSIGGLGVYSTHLSTFPWVWVSSPKTYASFAAFIVDNLVWLSYFTRADVQKEHMYWSVVSFFFVFVWLVPLTLFVTVAAADEQLPLGSAYHNSTEASSPTTPTYTQLPNPGHKRHTFASLLTALLPSRASTYKAN